MRWSGSGLGRVVGLGITISAAVFGGCARAPVVVEKEAPVTTVSAGDHAPTQALAETLSEAPVGAAARPGAAVDIREIKVIDDNGQQGLFVKLTGSPTGVTHYSLAQPPRLVIDIAGIGGEPASAQKYTVKNPLISDIRVGQHEGQTRITLGLRGDTVPTYTVNDLNDTVVAFIGEPNGGTRAVQEQVVFTRRAVDTAPTETATAAGSWPPAASQPGHNSPPAAAEVAARGRSAGEGPVLAAAPHAASRAYHGQHVSLDFKDADVHNVLRLLAEVSKLNIVATDDVHGKVTLRLFDVPWDQALDIILQVLNLESEQEGDVIRISTVKRLREEREELQRAMEAQKAIEPLRIEYIKVNYAKAKNLANIISGAQRTRQATRAGVAEEGVLSSRGSVFVDEFSNTLIVRDIPRGVETARDLVRRLDVQTAQVLIESNIVEATTDFTHDLGIQWGYRYLQGPATGNPTGVNFPGMIGFGGSGLGTGVSGVPYLADFPGANVIPGAGSALNLALGSIDGSQSLDVRITALEKDGKARVISRPRVVTLNNVPATIKSLTIIRVKLPSTGTVINTGAGGAAGSASTATEKIETGIILNITPLVSSDGFVLLDMFVKSSQADFARTVDQIPTEISREANSHILVKSGQTVVLGGIYRETFNDTQSGIPFLKDIPGLGWLFRSDSKEKRREDLLVFLTPHIMGSLHGALPSAEDLWKNRDGGS